MIKGLAAPLVTTAIWQAIAGHSLIRLESTVTYGDSRQPTGVSWGSEGLT